MVVQASIPGLTADQLGAASGLRTDLVARFVPATATPEGPRYHPAQEPLARFVKHLTDVGTPAEAVDAAVRDLSSRPGADITAALSGAHGSSRTGPRRWAVIGAAATAALILTGLIGGLIGANTTNQDRAVAPPPPPTTVTVPSEPEPLQAVLPTTPDPVCAEWGRLSQGYREKRAEWVKTDPNVPASEWSGDERQLSMAVIPLLRQEAEETEQLAERANDPILRSMMQLEALYQSKFADRLPDYTPSDKRLWVAVTDFSNAINSLCSAVVPR